MAEKNLTELAQNEEARIERVVGGRGLRERLKALGLREGQTVKRIARVAMGGPVIVLVERTQVAVGRGMAHKIIVRTENHDSPGKR